VVLAGTDEVDGVGGAVVVVGSLPAGEQAPRSKDAAKRTWAGKRCFAVIEYLTGERVPNTPLNPMQTDTRRLRR
jgi:hypothetical protein